VLLSLISPLLGLGFEALEAFFEASDSRLGFGVVEIALGITVDQTGDALTQFGDLPVDHHRVGLAGWSLNRFQPALVFVC